jgi:hypothetical protein
MDNLKEKEKEVVKEAPPKPTAENVTETAERINSPEIEEKPTGENIKEPPVAETTEKSPGTEAPETEMPEDNTQEKLKEFVSRFYPDADVSTPEKLMASLLPLVEQTVSLHDDLYQVVEEFPEFGDFILGLRKGYTPQQAMAMYFDVENLTPPEGAEDEEAVKKAKEERRKKVEGEKSRLAKIPENQKLTSKNFSEVVKDLKLSDEDQKSIVSNFENILNDAKDGVISKDHWEMLANGLKHEAVLSEKEKEKETAVEDARVKGRNEQIEKKRASKETGDGLPKLSSTGSMPGGTEEDEFTSGLKKIASKKKVI